MYIFTDCEEKLRLSRKKELNAYSMFLVQDIGVSRITAANYLNQLASDGFLEKHKLGTGNYYINRPLFKLISA